MKGFLKRILRFEFSQKKSKTVKVAPLSDQAFLVASSVCANLANARSRHMGRLIDGLSGDTIQDEGLIVFEQDHKCGVKSRVVIDKLGTTTLYLSGENQPVVYEVARYLIATTKESKHPFMINVG